MYECMNVNAREEHLSLLLLLVTLIYMNDPRAGEGLNVYSVIVCLCLCVRMYHGRSSISAFEMESKGLSKCHVELCQCELQMRVRQVGCDQGSCDVIGAMCVRVCVFVCVFVFVMRMHHGCFSMSIFEMESKERSNCHVELCQCELQMQVRQL